MAFSSPIHVPANKLEMRIDEFDGRSSLTIGEFFYASAPSAKATAAQIAAFQPGTRPGTRAIAWYIDTVEERQTARQYLAAALDVLDAYCRDVPPVEPVVKAPAGIPDRTGLIDWRGAPAPAPTPAPRASAQSGSTAPAPGTVAGARAGIRS